MDAPTPDPAAPKPTPAPPPASAAGPPVMPVRPRGGHDPVVIAFVSALVVLVLVVAAGATVIGRAWWLHRAGRIDDEITWLETTRALAPFELGLDAQLARLDRERVRLALDHGELAAAVQAFRTARSKARAAGHLDEPELTALGIECFTRAADHLEKLGHLSGAADWDDSLFVLAIRAREPHHRFAAVAAFQEGLDLRVRDGQPCAALARVEWARRGLGGTVPGLAPGTEDDLRRRCGAARGAGGR